MSRQSPITERHQADGIVNQPSLTDHSRATQVVVPSEDRDFSRPRNNFWAQEMSPDMSAADDSSRDWVRDIQKMMKNNPISPPYLGPIDGKINRKLLDVLLNFSWTLGRKTGKTYDIVQGNSINQSELSKALQDLKAFLAPSESKEEIEEKKPRVTAFQEFFGTKQPMIGTLYHGPHDGKMNPQLIEAAQTAEAQIAQAIDNERVHGMILSGGKFVTTPDDVAGALELIKEKA